MLLHVAAAARLCSGVQLTGVEWLSTLPGVGAGLTMALASVMEVLTMAPDDVVTVRLRCLAMFATPMRDRAAKRNICVKFQTS